MERWIKSGKRHRAEVLAQLYANHAYVKGLRKALRRRSRDSGSEVRK